MGKIKQQHNSDKIPGGLHATSNPAHRRPGVRRYAICGLILSLSALAVYFLSLRLISQIHYLRAINFMQHRHYGLAAQALHKASIYQPDDYKIQRQSGNAIHRLSELNPTPQGAYALAEKAAAHYREAFRLNPLDAQSVYGLAWQEDRLESLYTKLHPNDKAKPHHALPYYKMALNLRPHGVRYHYALAGYLYRKARHDELYRVIRRLSRIFPPAYAELKTKDFWSDGVKVACRKGLEEAVQDNVLPAAAHMGLAKIAEN